MTDVTKDLLEALLKVARMAEDLKKPCGTDPESPQAIRNAQYMNISYAARSAIARAEASTSAPQPDISLVMLMVDRYVAEAEVDGLMRGNASAQTLAAKKALEEYLRGMCLKHAGHCETNDADSVAKGVNRE